VVNEGGHLCISLFNWIVKVSHITIFVCNNTSISCASFGIDLTHIKSSLWYKQGLHLKKNPFYVILHVKTLQNVYVYRYLELKRYSTFEFIVILN